MALSDKAPVCSPAVFLANFAPIVGSGHQHNMAEAVFFLSYPKHALLERYLCVGVIGTKRSGCYERKCCSISRLWMVMMDTRVLATLPMDGYDESGTVTSLWSDKKSDFPIGRSPRPTATIMTLKSATVHPFLPASLNCRIL
ncbi:hypothetical protein TNCV_2724761 [Trichonephila clavipes]|nr:hypothetical protein TNCV_2724761 [Trichonephila clavipes]